MVKGAGGRGRRGKGEGGGKRGGGEWMERSTERQEQRNKGVRGESV